MENIGPLCPFSRISDQASIYLSFHSAGRLGVNLTRDDAFNAKQIPRPIYLLTTNTFSWLVSATVKIIVEELFQQKLKILPLIIETLFSGGCCSDCFWTPPPPKYWEMAGTYKRYFGILWCWGDSHRWWGLSHPTCCNEIHLNFLHSGKLKDCSLKNYRK